MYQKKSLTVTLREGNKYEITFCSEFGRLQGYLKEGAANALHFAQGMQETYKLLGIDLSIINETGCELPPDLNI